MTSSYKTRALSMRIRTRIGLGERIGRRRESGDSKRKAVRRALYTLRFKRLIGVKRFFKRAKSLKSALTLIIITPLDRFIKPFYSRVPITIIYIIILFFLKKKVKLVISLKELIGFIEFIEYFTNIFINNSNKINRLSKASDSPKLDLTSSIELYNNVFHKRAAHTSELRSPTNMPISNPFISTKTLVN
ncbi:hypothetical protein PCH_Pc22g10910 [Penicillium rubens Wisconsin 54-1255]|uniref:Uncharacterized protein n=1 Tax=Penicillium rubens (strain ATCC 28089 / DSM 1075 / NRRL 1951 / Wisconsin 54-1255) TaxID=500485 RepID=B6HVY2_PENRW|nr:hypothetical protein PCH_Pc22g10910 [Penicillium rubens Wisconsin 54-1255]